MSLAAFLVVLGTGLGWSALDLLRKLLVRDIRPTALVFLLTVAQTIVFIPWVLLDDAAHLETGYWLPALASVALNVVANVAMIQALSIAPLSLTIPLLSLTPALATLLAWPLLGEHLGIVPGTGVALVVVGAFLLNLDGEGRSTLQGLLRALREKRGTQLMALTALGWSLSLPLDKMALQASSSSVHALGLSLGVALGTLGVLVVRGELGSLLAVRKKPGLLAAGFAVSAVTTALQLIAIQMVLVGLVETVKRAVGNLAALLVGRAVFDEAITVRKVVAAVVMAAGVALIF